MDLPPRIQLERVSKRFGGVVALEDVSFEIRRGEIHAVVGENGAGKSTLMKLLSGVYAPDDGEIRIDGQAVKLKNPRDARRQGISIVFQELNLFPHRTVAANVFANRELTSRWGGVRRREMREATQRVLTEMSVPLSPDALVGPLTVGEKQLVEIARTLQQESRIIILDEPNSALRETESERLFEIIRRLRARGITIVYVSHRLEEVFAIADCITVIRDGRYQGTHRVAETTIPQIISAMIGRSLADVFPQRSAGGPPRVAVLDVRALCHHDRLGPISFSASAGEIVGFAGLEGAGVDLLFQVLFALKRMTSGEIAIGSEIQCAASPSAAMRHGWALIPASRRDEGLMMDWSVARNATLLVLDKLLSRLRLIKPSAVHRTTDHYVQRLGIATGNHEQKVMTLSGGNQQKVLLAKWLATAPTILLLNDPTRGVDVGAKREIYDLCRQLADEGLTILMTSSEVDEILGLADRVLVLSKGRISHEFARGAATKASLMHAMAGAAPLEADA